MNRTLVEQLAKVNPIHLSSNDTLAFWINIYNAMIMIIMDPTWYMGSAKHIFYIVILS